MTSRRRSVDTSRGIVLVVVVAIGLGAASGLAVATVHGGPSPSRAASERECAPTASPPPVRTELRLRASRVGDATAPTNVAFDPTRPGDGVVLERAGRVRRVHGGAVTSEVVLDLRDDTAAEGDGGLLGVAYDPDGAWLYLVREDGDGDDVLTAHPLDAEGAVEPGSGREVLRVDHPGSEQHHGGSLVADAGGLLYVGTGDGGGLGDPHGNAQDPASLLGKVLRIEPTPERARPYRVPADNPFVDRPGWAPEIWALGVRNPFRLTIDLPTGDLWLGDVGQSCWEELDRLRTGPGGAAGANLGWDRREGTATFEAGHVPGDELEPEHTYSHLGGHCAVVAGPVQRGGALPSLEGWLLFTDYCKGRVLARRADAGEPVVVDLGVTVDDPVSIVTGPAGRPWVVSLAGPIYELTDG